MNFQRRSTDRDHHGGGRGRGDRYYGDGGGYAGYDGVQFEVAFGPIIGRRGDVDQVQGLTTTRPTPTWRGTAQTVADDADNKVFYCGHRAPAAPLPEADRRAGDPERDGR